MKRNLKVSVVIPALNEEEAVASVVAQVPVAKLNARGYDVEIVVVDNASTDRTAEIARAAGATVVSQPIRGYGNAYKAGFTNATGDIIATGDADMTYPLDALPDLVAKLENEGIDFLNTDRLETLRKESMSTWHVFGNWVLTTITKVLFNSPFRDSQSGMWIFKRAIWKDLDVQSGGMPFSQELKLEAYWKGFMCKEVAIEYRPRIGEVKLRGIRDAWGNTKELFTKRLAIRRARKVSKRIAFVLDTIAPYSQGGRETRLKEVAERLAAQNDVHIYTMQWWKGGKTMVQGGVTYHAICGLHQIYNGDKRSVLSALIFAAATFKLLFARFDVLDVDSIPFFPVVTTRIVTWLRGKKLYATWHEVWGKEYWFSYMGGSSGLFGYVMERLAMLLPNVIISNSTHTTNGLRVAGAQGEIKTVTLGADIESIYSAEKGSTESDIIYVGRLLSHKNVEMLVGALKVVKDTMPDIKMLIVGDGPERNKIEERVNVLGLQDNISILSDVNHVDKYGLMKASKMLVLPSVREGFGLVIVEAHAAGIPVVTTSHKNNAAKDLVLDGVNGFLCKPTEEDLAAKILQVLRVRGTLDPRLGVSQYDWAVVAHNVESAFG